MGGPNSVRRTAATIWVAAAGFIGAPACGSGEVTRSVDVLQDAGSDVDSGPDVDSGSIVDSGPDAMPPDAPPSCIGPEDCPDPELPNCDVDTGACVAPCPETPCGGALPNCGDDGVCAGACASGGDCPPSTPNCDAPSGLCFGPCSTHSDCIDPAAPNCDANTGSCLGACPARVCPAETPNCAPDGRCFAPCASSTDCANPSEPNCDPATGLCQGTCPSVPCPMTSPNCDASGGCFGPCTTTSDCVNPAAPNCDDATGRCVSPCSSNADCPNATAPNCGDDGVCFALCGDHAECTAAARPNCQLDPALAGAGICGAACSQNADCPSAQFPNCDPIAGTCLPLCANDAGCPPSASKCDTSTGLCFQPGCTVDADCNPPTTVCENFFCVAGCVAHGDCLPSARCDLVGPTNVNHCEPRDCLSDADCGASTVCDTDGLADPNGGGFCVPGCATHYDCGQVGYDCNASTGTCTPHDYGDIGADCTAGCDSGFCLSSQGNVCTNFCCVQHDCPAGWGCRAIDDGTGNSRTVDVCVPLSGTGTGQYEDSCAQDADCRSGICRSGKCRETCCTDTDCAQPFVQGMHCMLTSSGNPSSCAPQPALGNAPFGTLGCGTTGVPDDCKSNMCFTFYSPDTGCTSNADCAAARPTCFDYPASAPDGVNDCVRDMCVDHCCSEDDCQSSGSDRYYCGEVVFSAGDFDVCLYHFGTGTLSEGDACTSNGACRSNHCSATGGVCRRRCCTDADCTDPRFPSCTLEVFDTVGGTRSANVCTP